MGFQPKGINMFLISPQKKPMLCFSLAVQGTSDEMQGTSDEMQGTSDEYVFLKKIRKISIL